jgi:hypothetical protein
MASGCLELIRAECAQILEQNLARLRGDPFAGDEPRPIGRPRLPRFLRRGGRKPYWRRDEPRGPYQWRDIAYIARRWPKRYGDLLTDETEMLEQLKPEDGLP